MTMKNMEVHMINLGNKIKQLRKQRSISQEVLAGHLGVSFQAVSKWETGAGMPDVTLIPAIASFFGVSTDELFDFNVYTIEQNVKAIVDEHSLYWDTDKDKAEQILREGLKKYPGNDVLLNCLIGVIPVPERSEEVIDLCRALIANTHMDDVKYDAYRILAEAYASLNEYSLAKEAIEQIPEIYFTKLGTAARLLKDEDMFEAAVKQRSISFEDLLDMCELLADYYIRKGDTEKAAIQLNIAKNLILSVEEDFATPFTRNLYTAYSPRIQSLKEKLQKIK